MADARFDIGAAAPLQSRDGGLTKGGQIRNGFVEKAPDGVWSWQRPALATSMAAPITGTGLGLIPYGGSLYGVIRGTSGTATTYVTTRAGTTAFSLLAEYSVTGTTSSGQVQSILGYSPLGGTLGPSTWKGQTVGVLAAVDNADTGASAFNLSFLGSLASPPINRFTLGGGTYILSQASYSYDGTNNLSLWNWSFPGAITAPGTYTGAFV